MQDKGKAVFAALYAVAAVVVPFFGGQNGAPDAEGWVQIAIAVVTAFGVYITPIIPGAGWTKTAVGVALAGLQVLTTVVLGGMTGAEWILVAAAIAGALGITVAPATSSNGVHVGWGSDSTLKYAAAA
jgi:hypothetical protein